ncbi:MADS-box transcription factor 56-like [Salvia hispanica]|uniref:MADS-box transcription factor 56-like n=1 Tax=Salvia hispanica TaxID=49212 RepID=UPI0020099D6A|nr:MADS-box transcription factor 56-like [Salvia hispanica]
MTRKKVTLAYVKNDSERKTSYKKRKKGLIKKVSELSTLSGVSTCVIIYSPYDPVPVPSPFRAQSVLARFRKLSNMDQSKKMVNEESFIRQQIDTLGFCMEDPYGYEQQGEFRINPALIGKNLLKICIAEVFEHRNVTNQRLKNLERNTSTLERGLATLVTQVEMLEFNLGILATIIGSRNTPGTLPSLPEVNPKGKCHAVQLRSGTTYQPPEAGDLEGKKGGGEVA